MDSGALMAFRHFFLSVVIVLSAAGSFAHADGKIIDYSLRWSHTPAEPISSNSANDVLYRISNVEPRVDVSGSDDFRILLPKTGISYSTHFKLAADAQQRQIAQDEPAHRDVSLVSQLYQIGYGEQLNDWYGGVNVSVEQFNGDYQRETGDQLSVGLYAGSRFELTGLGADSPLWLLSLQGEYDERAFDDNAPLAHRSDRGNWFITPGVHWNTKGFSLTAAVQLPLDSRRDFDDTDEPDYRIRADFEHRF